MYDEEGMVRQGKEVTKEWRRYIARVLYLNEEGSLQIRGGLEMGVDENELFDEEIVRKEVEES